ncbi:MAG TPA: GldG family protein [Candidatus Limnocylindria bacterium]|nr:GldG family protein [Candidatus Limnocylindria bacterium]
MRRPGLLLALQVVAVAGIIGCVVAIAARHPWRLDLTPEHRFTLSAHTRAVLAALPFPVQITYFYSADDQTTRREVTTLLALYADASPRLRVRSRDLDRSPGEARRLGVASYNVLALEGGGRHLRVDVPNEEFLTAALVRLTGTAPTIAYIVQGHGERGAGDAGGRRGLAAMQRALEADGYTTRSLFGAAEIPADAGLVVLAAPTRELHAREVEALDAWVRHGGGLLVFVEAPTPASVRRLLDGFGIEPGDDVVVDDQSRLLGADGLTARVAYLNEALAPGGLEVNALLPLAQTLRLVDRRGIESDYLAVTDNTAWADVDRRTLEAGPQPFRAGHDRPGPLPVAVFARVGPSGGRVVVIGDADFATNLHLDLLGNRELLAAAASLAARGTAHAERRPGRPGDTTFSPLVLSAREMRLLLAVAVLLPLVMFGAGGVLVWRRARA